MDDNDVIVDVLQQMENQEIVAFHVVGVGGFLCLFTAGMAMIFTAFHQGFWASLAAGIGGGFVGAAVGGLIGLLLALRLIKKNPR